MVKRFSASSEGFFQVIIFNYSIKIVRVTNLLVNFGVIWLCSKMFSSKREQRGCEQLLGGENIPKFRGKSLLSGVFAH